MCETAKGYRELTSCPITLSLLIMCFALRTEYQSTTFSLRAPCHFRVFSNMYAFRYIMPRIKCQRTPFLSVHVRINENVSRVMSSIRVRLGCFIFGKFYLLDRKITQLYARLLDLPNR